MITNRIPGGNIEVVSVNGHNVELDVELRDTAGDWFYWCFQAVFPEAGNWHFRFVRDNKVGTHGPAVSLDGGKSWRWLYPEYRENSREFDYACPAAGQTVLFCMGMQYLERDFRALLRAFEENPALHAGTLRSYRPVLTGIPAQMCRRTFQQKGRLITELNGQKLE